MKCLTQYSQTHAPLVNGFMMTCPFEHIEVRKVKQICNTGRFASNSWTDQCRLKIEQILDFIIRNRNEVFLFSDIDVLFFSDEVPEILGASMHALAKDIMFQNDNPIYCAGFMCIRSSALTERFFGQVYLDMKNHRDDQDCLNRILRQTPTQVRAGFLPNTFTCGDIPLHNKTILESMVMHHANHTIGTTNKLELQQRIIEAKKQCNKK